MVEPALSSLLPPEPVGDSLAVEGECALLAELLQDPSHWGGLEKLLDLEQAGEPDGECSLELSVDESHEHTWDGDLPQWLPCIPCWPAAPTSC